MRLLHARLHHDRDGVAAEQPEPERGTDPQGARGQPLPLHGLREHRQGGPDGERRRGLAYRGARSGRAGPGEGITMAISQMIGARIHRREDPHLITGRGRYVEDLVRPGTLSMAVVRSPHPHARITRINSAAAQATPGVVAVLTAADFKPLLSGTHPVAPAFVAEKHTVPDRFPIAESEVAFQGEPVAVVIAETRGQAVDAADLVEVEYEP